jgi:hypothetical protein
LLSSLKERYRLAIDTHCRTRSRIPASSGVAVFYRKRAEPAQLYTVALFQGRRDFFEYRRNDPLDIALIQMWIELGNALNQL